MSLVLAAGAGLLILALKGKPKPKTEEKPKPVEKANAGIPLASLGVVGAGLALSKAAADFGKALTDDDLGFVTGGLNFVQGTAVNLGRAGGKELDKLLGGSGTGETGTVAQATLGAAAGITSMLGAAFAAGTLMTGALVYAVAAIISDLNRLGYGQAGAIKDYDRAWVTAHNELFGRMIDSSGLSGDAILKYSYPYADGYMAEKNNAAWRMWMAKGRGLLGLGTTDDAYHAQFGSDRGYFVGAVSGGKRTTFPAEKTLTDDDFYRRAIFAHGDLVTETQQRIDKYVVNGAGRLSPVYKSVDAQVYVRRHAMRAVGGIAANVHAYRQWREHTPGVGVSLKQHVVEGIKQGQFYGDAGELGELTSHGYQVDSKGRFFFGRKTYTPAAESELVGGAQLQIDLDFAAADAAAGDYAMQVAAAEKRLHEEMLERERAAAQASAAAAAAGEAERERLSAQLRAATGGRLTTVRRL